MNSYCSHDRQRGVITIFIAMVMLLLVTLLVTTAFSLSTTNLRAVGNVQARDESISAAQVVIERIVAEEASLPAFQTARTEQVDINDDGTDDYTVTVPPPVCVQATMVNALTSSSVTLQGFSAGDAWNTIWEINAVATEATTGASVSVIHAIRVLLTDAEKNAVCA